MTIDLDVAIRILRLLTPLAASMAMGTVTLGLTTSHWLYSEEKMTNPKFNRTGDPELEYLSKFTSSGLWTLCYTNPGELERQCFNIDYFPVEEYSPDPNDSTLSIPYAVLKSSPFFLLAAVLLAVAEVACFLGHFVPRRRYCTFVSGVTFIITGLLLLLGLVVYVSVFTAEIGSKLKPTSTLQPALFTYTYGYSFQLVVVGFLAAEVAGTWAIFLFIYWHRNRIAKKEMHRKMTLALVQAPVLDLSAPAGIDQSVLMSNSSTGNGFPPHLIPPNPPCSCSFHHHHHSFEPETDESIPTPPPAIYGKSGAGHCPVHYVTVHHHQQHPGGVPERRQQSQGRPSIRRQLAVRDMPDVTAGREVMGGQRRQVSTDSDNSSVGYPQHHHRLNTSVSHDRLLAAAARHPPTTFEHKICFQCHGAGHVATIVPAPPVGSSASLPRDLTSSTVVTMEDEMAEDHHRPSVISHDGRRHSMAGQQQYGSLRRITAV